MTHRARATKTCALLLLGVTAFRPMLLAQAPSTQAAAPQASDTGEAAWEIIAGLAEDTRVKLVLRDRSEVTGFIVTVDEDGLLLRDVQTGKDGVRMPPGSSVQRFSVRRDNVAQATVLSAAPTVEGPVARSFEQLTLLVRPGDRISVTSASGTRLAGTVTSLSSSALGLQVGAERRTLGENDVATIKRRGTDSLANGARWGLGVGAATGMLACGVCHVGPGLMMAGIYAAIGTGVGVGVDALIKGDLVVYQRQRSSPRVAIVPQLSKSHKAVALTVGF